MTRSDIYEMSRPLLKDEYGNVIGRSNQCMPESLIDAIIDCAVEEAVKAMKEGKQE